MEAEQIHAEMKAFWREFSNTDYNKDVLKQLSHVLFMKRKEVRSDGAGELDHAFASEQETWRAIRDVLERRQSMLVTTCVWYLGRRVTRQTYMKLRSACGVAAGKQNVIAPPGCKVMRYAMRSAL